MQTILRILQDSGGYDGASPFTVRLAKKLSKSDAIQHYANGLQAELFRELNKIRSKSGRRPSLKKLKLSKSAKPLKMENISASQPMLEVKFRVPNLTVGKPFKEVIKPLEDLTGKLLFSDAKGHEAITGLVIDKAKFLIEGTITAGGDYDVEIMGILLCPTGVSQLVRGKLKITVIPDPRSLWKNLPSDGAARFHKPDSVSDSGSTASVTLMAASVRGRSHAHKGIHRDDDIKISCSSPPDWNVVCVADGAGSCKYARRGAELAVLHATHTLRETLNGRYGVELESVHTHYLLNPQVETNRRLQEAFQQTIVKAAFDAVRAIQAEAEKNKEDTFKDYSTTLLLAAYKPVENGHLILSFWIGDGAAVVYHKGRNVMLLGEPDSGDYAGQTRFLDTNIFDDGSVYGRVTMKKVDSMTALILATDGITDARFDTEKQLSSIDLWDALWSELEPFVSDEDLKKGETGLTRWMDFWSPGNHDDRSIAICYVKK